MPWAPAAGGRQGGGDGAAGPSRCHLGQPRCRRSPCAPWFCSSLFLFLFFIAFISSFCPRWGARSQLNGEGVWEMNPPQAPWSAALPWGWFWVSSAPGGMAQGVPGSILTVSLVLLVGWRTFVFP